MRETLKAMVKVCNLPRDLLKYSHEIAFEKSETVEIPDLLPRNGVNRFESFIFIWGWKNAIYVLLGFLVITICKMSICWVMKKFLLRFTSYEVGCSIEWAVSVTATPGFGENGQPLLCYNIGSNWICAQAPNGRWLLEKGVQNWFLLWQKAYRFLNSGNKTWQCNNWMLRPPYPKPLRLSLTLKRPANFWKFSSKSP